MLFVMFVLFVCYDLRDRFYEHYKYKFMWFIIMRTMIIIQFKKTKHIS